MSSTGSATNHHEDDPLPAPLTSRTLMPRNSRSTSSSRLAAQDLLVNIGVTSDEDEVDIVEIAAPLKRSRSSSPSLLTTLDAGREGRPRKRQKHSETQQFLTDGNLEVVENPEPLAGPSRVKLDDDDILPEAPKEEPPDVLPIPAAPTVETNLSEYTCPICFCAPTNATLTPCGHVLCGSCLFTAVKSSIRRSAHLPDPDAKLPRCVLLLTFKLGPS